MSRLDTSGEFFFTALGAVTGFFAGAGVALIQGKSSEDIINDALAGAVGGAIAGAGVDTALLVMGTFGTALPVIALAGGIAFATGGIGNAVATEISSRGNATEDELNTAFVIGGVANVISLGTGLAATGSSLEAIAVAGMDQLAANTKIGFLISYTASVVTTLWNSARANISKQ